MCVIVAISALTADTGAGEPSKQSPNAKKSEAKKPNAPFPGWTAQRKRVKVATPQGDRFKEITYYTNPLGMKFVLIPLASS